MKFCLQFLRYIYSHYTNNRRVVFKYLIQCTLNIYLLYRRQNKRKERVVNFDTLGKSLKLAQFLNLPIMNILNVFSVRLNLKN